MSQQLYRVGTTYLPVLDPKISAEWYVLNLGAVLSYLDPHNQKAIIDFANQSFFLVKAKEGQNANFIDIDRNERFSITFEVNGIDALNRLHGEYKEKGIKVGRIEDRGHPGKNFVFYDPDGNMFDVWSELSLSFKGKYSIK